LSLVHDSLVQHQNGIELNTYPKLNPKYESVATRHPKPIAIALGLEWAWLDFLFCFVFFVFSFFSFFFVHKLNQIMKKAQLFGHFNLLLNPILIKRMNF